MVSYVIPRISSILKIRAKKVLIDSKDLSNSSIELNSTLSQYDTFLFSVSSSSRGFLQQSNESTNLQIAEDINQIFKNQLNRRTQLCLSFSASLLAKKVFILKLIQG
tara:strand:+ start:372 stop:692 length:321 start_codon:yes stop_codon:yes gene_type:complete